MRSIVSPLDGVESPFGPRRRARQEFLALLQQFSGAAAAYSLRDLTGTNPSVVRVRRSSDNAEQDFTAKQINDGSLLAWVGSNYGLVSVWYDQSSGGNNATQTVASGQPLIVGAGVLATEGGKPALFFDGVENFFDLGTPGPYSITDSFTLESWVATNGTDGQIIGFDDSLPPRTWQFRGKNNGKFHFTRFDSSANVINTLKTPDSYNTGNRHHLSAVFDNATGSKIYVDGLEVASDTDTTNNDDGSGTKLKIGARSTGVEFFDGSISEVSIWTTALTQQQIQTIMTYSE